MNWLLDTHLAIFCLAEPEKLTLAERTIIQDPSSRVMVSLVSVWEIAVKNSLSGGHRRPFQLTARLALEAFEAGGYEMLPITGRTSARSRNSRPCMATPSTDC